MVSLYRITEGADLIGESFMEYNIIINGIKVQAAYRDEDVRDIFIPLLDQLEILRAKKRARILVMLAAPPGAGKSTLASFFEHLAKDVLPII